MSTEGTRKDAVKSVRKVVRCFAIKELNGGFCDKSKKKTAKQTYQVSV